MPAYFLHTNDLSADFPMDPLELATLGHAYVEAAALLASLVRDEPERWDDFIVAVADDGGQVLFMLQMRDITPASTASH